MFEFFARFFSAPERASVAEAQRRRSRETEARLTTEAMKAGGERWDGHRLRLQNRAEHVGEVIARPFSRLEYIEQQIRARS